MSETALKLRSSNFSSMEITTPTAGYTAGQMVKIEDTVGVIAETKTVGQTAVLIYKAEKIVVPKGTGAGENTLAAGDKVYFDATDANVNSASSGNTLCGRCLVAAGAAATTVEIQLNGDVAA